MSIKNVSVLISILKSSKRTALNVVFNKIWFIFNYQKYRKFVKKCVSKGYNPKDVWYNWRIGFICMPPNNEDRSCNCGYEHPTCVNLNYNCTTAKIAEQLGIKLWQAMCMMRYAENKIAKPQESKSTDSLGKAADTFVKPNFSRRGEMRIIEQENPQFDITDRGYNVKCWYVKDIPESKGDALVIITKEGKTLREFLYPAYKIYNIAAHFLDIVNSEIEENDKGYRVAGNTGFGGCVMPSKID